MATSRSAREKKWPLKIIDYFNRIRVIEVYKRLLWLGREWHQGPKKFNRSLNAAFSKNKNESDPEKIEKLIAHAEFVEKEIMALYSLKERLIYISVDCQRLFLTSSDTEWQTPLPPLQEFSQKLCDADPGEFWLNNVNSWGVRHRGNLVMYFERVLFSIYRALLHLCFLNYYFIWLNNYL